MEAPAAASPPSVVGKLLAQLSPRRRDRAKHEPGEKFPALLTHRQLSCRRPTVCFAARRRRSSSHTTQPSVHGFWGLLPMHFQLGLCRLAD